METRLDRTQAPRETGVLGAQPLQLGGEGLDGGERDALPIEGMDVAVVGADADMSSSFANRGIKSGRAASPARQGMSVRRRTAKERTGRLRRGEPRHETPREETAHDQRMAGEVAA